jgi:hypothetical protein
MHVGSGSTSLVLLSGYLNLCMFIEIGYYKQPFTVLLTHMTPQVSIKNNYEVIKIAVIIAIFFGVLTSFFFMMVDKESYSAVYIVPGSIIHNSNENTVIYQYGVKSFESGKKDYTLNTYINSTLVKSRQFSLNNGEIFDGKDVITLPVDIPYPSKISLSLLSDTATEEVHFWINQKSAE